MKKFLTLSLIALTTLSLSGCSFVKEIGQLYKNVMLNPKSEIKPEEQSVDSIIEPNSPKNPQDELISDVLNITVAKYQVSHVLYNDPSGHRLCTFINMQTNEYIEFDLDAEDSCKFPQHYLDYSNYLDFVICHQEDKVLAWDAYTRDTQELVNDCDKETLAKLLHLNLNFGNYAYLTPIPAPDVIRLSEWAQHEFVCFKLSQTENGKYFIPPVINDSFSHVGKVQFDYFTPEYHTPMDCEYHINLHLWESTYRETNEDCIVFSWTSVPTTEVESSKNLVYLSDYQLNDIIPVHFNHYFYNNTDKTITLSTISGDQYIVIPPSLVGEVTWTLDEVVISKIS